MASGPHSHVTRNRPFFSTGQVCTVSTAEYRQSSPCSTRSVLYAFPDRLSALVPRRFLQYPPERRELGHHIQSHKFTCRPAIQTTTNCIHNARYISLSLTLPHPHVHMSIMSPSTQSPSFRQALEHLEAVSVPARGPLSHRCGGRRGWASAALSLLTISSSSSSTGRSFLLPIVTLALPVVCGGPIWLVLALDLVVAVSSA